MNHTFKNFFITGNEVAFPVSINKFEGRSNYFHYFPTGSTLEQKLEKMWQGAQNKEI
jgi:hypothetical protein